MNTDPPMLIPERYWETTSTGLLFIFGSEPQLITPRKLTSRYMEFAAARTNLTIRTDMPYNQMDSILGNTFGMNRDIYQGIYHLGSALTKARAKSLNPQRVTRNLTRTWVQGVEWFVFDEIDRRRIRIRRDTSFYEFRQEQGDWSIFQSCNKRLSRGVEKFLFDIGPTLCSIIPEYKKEVAQDLGELFAEIQENPHALQKSFKKRAQKKARLSTAPLQGRLL
jgi:hypothetical protein